MAHAALKVVGFAADPHQRQPEFVHAQLYLPFVVNVEKTFAGLLDSLKVILNFIKSEVDIFAFLALHRLDDLFEAQFCEHAPHLRNLACRSGRYPLMFVARYDPGNLVICKEPVIGVEQLVMRIFGCIASRVRLGLARRDRTAQIHFCYFLS